MRVIALFGRGNTGKTSCLGHLINLIYRETNGYNYLFEGQDVRITLNYMGKRITICTWGDTDIEERLNLEKIQNDNPDIAIVATRTKGDTVTRVEEFCNKTNSKLKWVEKYVASFDGLSGQEYLNNKQAEQLLDYVRGLIEGQLYYIDSISNISENKERFHVTLIGADMPIEGFPRTLSLELDNRELVYYETDHQIREDDFVLYNPDSGFQFLYGNEDSLAIDLRNRSRNLRRELSERELRGEEAHSFLQRTPNKVMSYHVNVGHGNCSLILSIYGTDYELWMVDCSIYDYLIRRDYSQSLFHCLKEIANNLKIELKNLHISRFMLTHTHFDHYNGLSYLIKQGLFDKNTLIYANLYYECSSPVWVGILNELRQINCHFVEPVVDNKRVGAIHIYHPEYRIVKNGNSALDCSVVGNVNDSSVVYGIVLGGKIMVFPGDLEQNGFKSMIANCSCSAELYAASFYVVSHHGSINGHPTMPCKMHNNSCSPFDCAANNLIKAILMGRDKAYSGIYNQFVLNAWGNKLVKTERAQHYLVQEWNHGVVSYH